MFQVNSTNISQAICSYEQMIVTYYPLTLVIIGTLLNILTFCILFRPKFRDTSRRSTIHYMRAITIFDILMLYGWNLDHYLHGAFGFTLLTYSIGFCKLFSFLNYFAAQVSAWLRVFISLERYLVLSSAGKTWFSHSKNILIVITSIITIFSLLNCHFLLFACFYQQNGQININSYFYRIYPIWDYINLVLYNCIPFILMCIFNIGVIYHIIRLRETMTNRTLEIQHRSISITLMIVTCLFLIMTIPATIGYAFFSYTTDKFALHILDSILYTYHILSFPIYLMTFGEFRKEFKILITPTRYH